MPFSNVQQRSDLQHTHQKWIDCMLGKYSNGWVIDGNKDIVEHMIKHQVDKLQPLWGDKDIGEQLRRLKLVSTTTL